MTVEFGTLEWVDWWNHRRLLEPIGMIPSAEAGLRPNVGMRNLVPRRIQTRLLFGRSTMKQNP